MVLPCSYLRQLLEAYILLILHLNVKIVVLRSDHYVSRIP